MKVKELIEVLQRMNPNADMRYWAEEALENRSFTVTYTGKYETWEEDPAGIKFDVDGLHQSWDNREVYLLENWEDEKEEALQDDEA